MNYIELMEDALDYIEDNLKNNLSLTQLSSRYGISKYYFSRIFNALTHKKLRDYLYRRKIACAARILNDKQDRILDIALEFGYESHEAFSREFTKVTGFTPSFYRAEYKVFYEPQIEFVKRDFVNCQGKVIPKCRIIDCTVFDIKGINLSFNPDNSEELAYSHEVVKNFSEKYIEETKQSLFNITKEEFHNGKISYFTGVNPFLESSENLELFQIPASSYAVFEYQGNMMDIFGTVMIDICRFMDVSGNDFNKTTIELFEKYDDNYYKSGLFRIFVPIFHR